MSFLAPMFLLGALTVALPILFHLLRRSTQDRVLFSSLMFLRPSPPRFSQRRRFEHWLLLLLRCAVIVVLALGFARPFLNRLLPAPPPTISAKRMAILLDTSASMRRAGAWTAAQNLAIDQLRLCRPGDRVTVATFDRQLTTMVSLAEWEAAGPADRIGWAIGRIQAATPGWAGTDLGLALTSAAESLFESEESDTALSREIVVITDLQEGSRLEALQTFSWPKGISVSVLPVAPKQVGNASLQWMLGSQATSPSAPQELRVRISNSPDSIQDKFTLSWEPGDNSRPSPKPTEIYLPAGQSRVITLAAPADARVDRLVLQGDSEDFDNTLYLARSESKQSQVLYLGSDDPQKPRTPSFFLQRAWPASSNNWIGFQAWHSEKPLARDLIKASALVIVSGLLPAESVRMLREELLAGKTVLFIPLNASCGPTLAGLIHQPSVVLEERQAKDFFLWTELDLRHALLAPLAEARFSDFTKIHFWRYRHIPENTLPSARALVRFDTGAPALIEIPAGQGSLFILAAGWHPEDSQLALSSRFVPLLQSFLDLAQGTSRSAGQFFVGDTIALQDFRPHVTGTLLTPANKTVPLTAENPRFTGTQQPGVYRWSDGSMTRRFAVNLAPSESRTRPMAIEDLEKLGLPRARAKSDPVQLVRQQALQQRIELENRQKLWRWLIASALFLLLVESCLAGWTLRHQTSHLEGVRL
ncbi:MAG TPA: BatA domain-containing protein [Candidatus Paceibacterota bacterium]|nr:BatA domain-containing protein [Candidatus Paceibacterota bacterium]